MRVLPRGVVSALVGVQAVAALGVAVLGIVTAVVGRRQNVRGGSFADLVTVVGLLLAGGGLLLGVTLVLALSSWRRGRGGAAALTVFAEALVLGVGGAAALSQHRFWPLPVSAFVVVLAVLLARPRDDAAVPAG